MVKGEGEEEQFVHQGVREAGDVNFVSSVLSYLFVSGRVRLNSIAVKSKVEPLISASQTKMTKDACDDHR